MDVLGNGIDHRPVDRLVLMQRWIGMQTFAHAPAVVAALGDDVHLFIPVLPDIAGVEEIGFAIETESPRISQAIREDFRRAIFSIGEGIVLGNAVRIAIVHVDAEDFPRAARACSARC